MFLREPRTLLTQLRPNNFAEGASVNPTQAGFHHIKRKCLENPFTANMKKVQSFG